MGFPFDLSPDANDPGRWGASLLYNGELVLACLDAAGARSVVEVGAYAGDLTRLLLRWAERPGGRVVAVDPAPQPELVQLGREHPELELIRETSLEALARIAPADAIILDGDHNHYTVSAELRCIAERSERAGAELPLILLHDVGWPHGRRDDYFDPEQIPAEFRQPVAPEGALYPGVPGADFGGIRYHWPAAREGGPRNGVLTAIEDFISGRDELQLAIVPAFFGLGILWSRAAPYQGKLAQVLAPWDRNPMLERLEGNRALHLASSQVQLRRAHAAEERLARQDALLQRMLDSRAFAAAEMFLRVRQRGKPAFSREQIRRSMASDGRPGPGSPASGAPSS